MSFINHTTAIKKGISWHSLSFEEVLSYWSTSVQTGLSPSEINERLRIFGPNVIARARKRSVLTLFLRQFKSPLIYILFLAAAIALSLGERTDALVIVTVLMINAVIGSFQEGKAERSMEALRKLTAVKARVLRNGDEQLIDAADLVPGDILILSAGDAVGADARLIETSSLEISEAALTGESLPVLKNTDKASPDTLVVDRKNMIFAGTYVTVGRGKAVVVSTGLSTEVGKIASLTQSAKEPKTPLEVRIAKFSHLVIYAAGTMVALVLLVGFLKNLPFSQIFMVALSQMVSMVPEGLPVAMTVALAVGVHRMSARGAVVRKLAAVETLGSTNIICTDKTGTLTRNEMTVAEIFLPPDRLLQVTGSGYAPEGEILESGTRLQASKDIDLQALLEAAIFCNDAKLIPTAPDGQSWKVVGDPTEAALITLAKKAQLDPNRMRHEHPRIGEIPFNSEDKIMAVQVAYKGKSLIFIKGAPEILLEFSSHYQRNGEVKKIDNPFKSFLRTAEREMANKALRLLSFAVIEDNATDLQHGLHALSGRARFLGVVGQFDPPRAEIYAAVEACHSAGIRPVMVTGDHKVTGLAVAKLLKIASADDQVIDGQELAQLSEEELRERLPHTAVFARVHPAQKLKLVEALQSQNAVVAMTGDGVNDAPALARSDVGVAMGTTGTEVAKEASEIVISDDNFATIIAAIEEGRIVYRNLKKLLLYLVSTSVSEVIILFAALLSGLPIPLAAVQILWVNLITDGTLTAPIIMTPSEGDEMQHAPIPRREPLFTRDILSRMAVMVSSIVIATLSYFLLRLNSNFSYVQVQTGTFTVLVVCQWLNGINCISDYRSSLKISVLRHKWLIGGLIVANILHVMIVFAPPFNHLFHTTPIPISEVVLIGTLSSLVLWTEELRKLFARRKKRKITGYRIDGAQEML